MTEQEGRRTVEYQKDVFIDGDNYKILVLPPSRSLKLLTKMARILGEPFAQMAQAGKDAKGDEKAAKEAAAKMLPIAVRALVQKLDEGVVLGIVQELVATTQIDNKPVNFEIHFQGRLGTLFKVLKSVLEVQYEDFFQALVDLMGSME